MSVLRGGRGRRRLLPAVLAAAALYLALTVLAAPIDRLALAAGLPSASPCPSSSPTPTPLVNLGGCTQLPGTTPTPASSASPSASPGRTPGSSPTPASGSGAPPPGSPSQPGQPPALPPTIIPGTLVVADPLLAAEVSQVLQNPVIQQRPDLVHFNPPTFLTRGGGTSSGIGAEAGSSLAGVGVPFAGAATAIVVLCGLALVQLRGRGVRLRYRARFPISRVLAVPALTAVPVGAAALLLIAGEAAPLAAPARASGARSPSVSMMGALRAHSAAVPLTAVSQSWTSLVSIETSINVQHDRLVSDEQLMAAATEQLDDAAAGGSTEHSIRPGYVNTLKGLLQLLVDDHQRVAAAYDASLQREYDFFVSTAQSSQATTQLQTVVTHTPPEVQNAVVTDLTMVQTQLQQEAAIAAANAAPQAPSLPLGAVTFHAPLSGVVTQAFGPTQFSLEPPVTYHGVFYPHFHTGLDIAAPLDTPVGAAAAGVVVLATSSVDAHGNLVGYGNYVVIKHGTHYETLYGHLDKLLVTVGQTVKQGQVIGLCGSTGWSTGPHVHFEIRLDGVYVDPAPYLAAQLKP